MNLKNEKDECAGKVRADTGTVEGACFVNLKCESKPRVNPREISSCFFTFSVHG